METRDFDPTGLNVYLHLTGNHRWVPFRRPVSLAGFGIHHDLAAVRSMFRNERSLPQDIGPFRQSDNIGIGNRPIWRAPHHDSPLSQGQILFGRLELLRRRIEQLLLDLLDGKANGGAHTIGRPAGCGHPVKRSKGGVRFRNMDLA